jgi:hypothetical protein
MPCRAGAHAGPARSPDKGSTRKAALPQRGQSAPGCARLARVRETGANSSSGPVDKAARVRLVPAPAEPSGFVVRARAQVAELVDALASGASDRKVVEVRVLSWAPWFGASQFSPSPRRFFIGSAGLDHVRRAQTLWVT